MLQCLDRTLQCLTSSYDLVNSHFPFSRGTFRRASIPFRTELDALGSFPTLPMQTSAAHTRQESTYTIRVGTPIRPTCRHITTSPHGGLYVMPSLCCSSLSLGDLQLVPRFRCLILLNMSSSKTPESPSAACTQFLRRRPGLRPFCTDSALSIFPPPSASGGSHNFVAIGSLLLRPAELLASLGGPD
jgi:hypothetical protein